MPRHSVPPCTPLGSRRAFIPPVIDPLDQDELTGPPGGMDYGDDDARVLEVDEDEEEEGMAEVIPPPPPHSKCSRESRAPQQARATSAAEKANQKSEGEN